jgi:pseudouridine kinase
MIIPMDKQYFVLGAAITDWMGFPQREPAVADSVPGRIIKAAGGVGRNLAENMVRLGLQVELLTAFGEDLDSKQLISHCQDTGIGIRHSLVAEGYRGAIHLAILDREQDLHSGLADLQVLEVIGADYLQQQWGALSQAEAIVVETNMPEIAIDWLLAQEWEVPLYLDPVSVSLSAKVRGKLAGFQVLKANKRQAEALLGKPITTRSELQAAARHFLAQGLEQVYLTLGSEGAYAASQQGELFLPAAKVQVSNTTGAGDAFLAGVLWARNRNWPLDDCCRAGLAAATLAVKSGSTVNPKLNETTLLEHIRKFC